MRVKDLSNTLIMMIYGDYDDADDVVDDESIVTNLSNTSPSFFTKAIVDMH